MRAFIFAFGLMAALIAGAANAAADAVELEFWRSVQSSGTRADYQAYLNRYPYGDFADLARNRLHSAGAGSGGGSGAGEGAYLSYSDRRAAQASLTRQGYDTRGVDGVFGPGTRRAIRQWQADQGYAATGYLSRAQFDTLTRAAAPPPRRKVRDEAAWEVAVAQGDIPAYRRYLERYPDGAHAQQARNRIERKLERRGDAGAGGGVRAQREAALGLNRRQREAVEWRLSRAGYYPGAINGRFDADTRRAIRAFRRDNGLDNHAYLSRKMLRKLVQRTGGIRRDRGYGEDYSNFAAGAAVGALTLGGILLLTD